MPKTIKAGWTCVLLFAAAISFSTSVDAATRCVRKTADGTGPNIKVARFQVYEGLLKSLDSGVWLQWLVDGTTPGYRVAAPTYVCRTGQGLGVSCRGRANICRP